MVGLRAAGGPAQAPSASARGQRRLKEQRASSPVDDQQSDPMFRRRELLESSDRVVRRTDVHVQPAYLFFDLELFALQSGEDTLVREWSVLLLIDQILDLTLLHTQATDVLQQRHA